MSFPFSDSSTFMGVPAGRSFTTAKAVVLGLPFDCGTHAQRVGARLGPGAIREQSRLLTAFDPASESSALAELGVIDAGDAAVSPGVIDRSYEAIEAAVHAIAAAGAVPLTLGGDGAIALPEMRALHRVYPDLVAIHIDAHTDAYPLPGFNTATPFSRAAEEKLLDTQRSFHIGLRGNTLVPGVYCHSRDLGYGIRTMKELRADGVEAVFNEICERVGQRPVYFCFDMDFFDPSVAPGVCTPTWGGGSVEEGLAIVEACRNLRIVCFDVNTISPPHDSAGMSAHLAATLVSHVLNGLAQRMRR